MSTAAAVLVCALNLLGRSAVQLPPIVLIEARPGDVSPAAEAFVRRSPNAIYLLTGTATFRAAMRAERVIGRCGDRDSLRKIASMVVHEEWHLMHGPDERGAYFAQLTALTILGAGPGTRLHHSVMRAMEAAVHATDAPAQMARR